MPVVLDALQGATQFGSANQNTGFTTLTDTGFTVGSGSNRALIVALIVETTGTLNNLPATPTAHWDSTGANQNMTLVCSSQDKRATNFAAIYFFALVAPTSGNKTLSLSGFAATVNFTFTYISFTGVNQTGGATSFANAITNNTATGPTVTASVTAGTNDAAIGFFGTNATTGQSLNKTPWITVTTGPLAVDFYASCYDLSPGSSPDVITFTTLSTFFAFYAAFDIVGAAVLVPKNNYDFPNPRAKIAVVDLNNWIYPTQIKLIGKDKFYGGPGYSPDFDYQNPWAKIPSVVLKTWVDATKIQLIGKDNFYGKGNNPEYDFPNPRGPVGSVALKTNLIDGFKVNLLGQDQFYGAGNNPEYDFPNPKGATPALELKTWIQNLNLVQTGASPVVTSQLDWPVPKAATPATDLRNWIDQTKINLIGQDRFYGVGNSPEYDFPNPRAPNRSPDLGTWIPSYPFLISISTTISIAWNVPFEPPKAKIARIDPTEFYTQQGSSQPVTWYSASELPPKTKFIIDDGRSFAETAATLPTQISGMAWHVAYELKPLQPRVEGFKTEARGAVPYTFSGMAWQVSYELPHFSPAMPQFKQHEFYIEQNVGAPSISGMPWHIGYEPPPPTKFRFQQIEGKSAFSETGASLPTPISGMAWHGAYEAPRFKNPPPWMPFEARGAIPASFVGMAWQASFEPPRFGSVSPQFKYEAYAQQNVGAPVIAGVSWHTPYEPPRFRSVPVTAKFDIYSFSSAYLPSSSPISGMAWHIGYEQPRFDVHTQRLEQFNNWFILASIPTLVGMPWYNSFELKPKTRIDTSYGATIVSPSVTLFLGWQRQFDVPFYTKLKFGDIASIFKPTVVSFVNTSTEQPTFIKRPIISEVWYPSQQQIIPPTPIAGMAWFNQFDTPNKIKYISFEWLVNTFQFQTINIPVLIQKGLLKVVHAIQDFTPCGTSETVLRAFNFAPALNSNNNETLVGNPICVVTVDIGQDTNPQSIIKAGPTISGTFINLLIGGMQPDTTYSILTVVNTSAGQVLGCWAYQSCYPP